MNTIRMTNFYPSPYNATADLLISPHKLTSKKAKGGHLAGQMGCPTVLQRSTG